jgi:5-methylcytosine-specific restriction endonuclease McrA
MESNPYIGLSEQALNACIKRMAKTLTSKPRRKKTRQYVNNIRGREAKTREQAEKELRALASRERFESGRAAAKVVIALAEAGVARPPIARRKQRVSPITLHNAVKAAHHHALKHCRQPSRFKHGIVGGKHDARPMEKLRALRYTLHAAQDGICGICGKPLDANPVKSSLDHVIPRSRVPREKGNYVLTHGGCNGDKANDIPTGCEMVFLLMVNCKLGIYPQVF